MEFDPWTLWVIIGLVGLFSAGATFFAWALGGREVCLAQWGFGTLALAVGIAGLLLRDFLPSPYFGLLPNAVLLAGYSLQWVALRSVAGRRSQPWRLIAAPAAWCVLVMVPPFAGSMHDRLVLFAALVVALTFAAAREIWRAPIPEPALRRGLLAMSGTLLVLNLVRLVAVLLTPREQVLTIVSPEAAIYGVIGMGLIVLASFLLVLLVREQAMRELREEAARDELTGLANRRGFLARARAICAQGGALALLMLDLDHLKAINDRHGHAAGDRMLALFGEILRQSGLAGAVAGRLGGEEFAVLLPGADEALAHATAERLRQAFREASTRIAHEGGVPAFLATVSIGVATRANAPAGKGQGDGKGDAHGQAILERLCAEADAALYRAKQAGRDRVELCQAVA